MHVPYGSLLMCAQPVGYRSALTIFICVPSPIYVYYLVYIYVCVCARTISYICNIYPHSDICALTRMYISTSPRMQDSRTALMEAAKGGYSDIAELLLQRKADVEAQDKVVPGGRRRMCTYTCGCCVVVCVSVCVGYCGRLESFVWIRCYPS